MRAAQLLNSHLRQYVFLAFVCIATTTSHQCHCEAAKPNVSWIFPAGGQPGTTVSVKFATKKQKTPPDVWCSEKSLQIATAKESNAVSISIPEDTQPGICWLRFFNAEGASKARPFLIGSTSEVNEVEPNNRLSSAQELPNSTICINGVLHKSGEVDTFRVTLKKEQTLVVSMTAHHLLASPMDPVVQVVSSRGHVLAQNDDDHGFDPQLVYTATEDGDIYVRTFAFPSTPNSTIAYSGAESYVYRLLLTTDPFIDHIQPTITNATAQNVSVVGWNIPTDQKSIELPADQKTVTADNFSNWYRPAHTTFENIVLKDPAGKSTSCTLPALVSGFVPPNSADVWEFAGKKNQTVIARIRARADYSSLDPVLRLVSQDNKLLKEVDDSTRKVADCVLEYKLRADGTYRLLVLDAFGNGGPRHFYGMEISEPRSSFTIAATGPFIVTSKKPLEIPVTISRTRESRPIEISVEGCPDGVTATPVKSAGKGATAKAVKLRLTSTRATEWSGPIRIRGHIQDEPADTFATAATADHFVLQDFWLTVVKP